ncbi:diacylglycerol kinase [Alginatibacterium sediminis]|uniref:Diacylglycerol kinase n=1 Tax=Alginatibacterium sediminis TaxID=2164068 RepID=A0A420E7X2_9ALTE|nr:diacylglycerol kinase [Alginatibacterium sediminis]RKF15576.1 diacylglycerol kinase [Alginatibacterium sediminis]
MNENKDFSNSYDKIKQRRRELELRLRQDLERIDALRREVEQRLNQEVVQLVAASGHSLRGLNFAARHERAFRLELLCFIFVIPLGLWLGDNMSERAILIGVCALVLITELLNSAIEATVDRISLDHHELSGRAKDLGSAAVWISIVLAIVVWIDKLSQYIG